MAVGLLVRRRLEVLASLAWDRERVQMIAEIPEPLPEVFADAGRLDQILTNLLRNALRHTPPGGIIIVRAAAESGRVRLAVCDTGEGIPRKERSHIWEYFYRGTEARVHDQHGAGLGLPLVKELTEAMGGSVEVESEVGAGSCFNVDLPVWAWDAPQLRIEFGYNRLDRGTKSVIMPLTIIRHRRNQTQA